MLFEVKKVIKKGDYLYALVPNHPNATKNGYVLMHRVVMENHLGIHGKQTFCSRSCNGKYQQERNWKPKV